MFILRICIEREFLLFTDICLHIYYILNISYVYIYTRVFATSRFEDPREIGIYAV